MIIEFYPTPTNIQAGFTTRCGGVSKPPFDTLNTAFYVGDQDEDVLVNRHRIAEALGTPVSKWVIPKLTHSDHIYIVTEADCGKGAYNEDSSHFDVDAVYTFCNEIALGVFSADCIPILFYSEVHHVIGAIHSGWLGTTKELVSKTMKHLIEVEHCDPTSMHVFFGPSIRLESFEVQEDVLNRVKNMSFDTKDYIHTHNHSTTLDLVGLNVKMLLDAGVPREQIIIHEDCTYQKHPTYFSYRADKTTGRHLSLIVQSGDFND